MPGPTPLALVTDRRDHSCITTTQPLCHTASSRVHTTQPRTPQDLARTNTVACDQPRYQPCSPRLAPQYSPSGKLAKVPSIVTSLYLVPFHLCTLLFSFSAYHCPVPALYLSRCLLRFSRLIPGLVFLPVPIFIIRSSPLLYAACPPSQTHRLTSRPSYISLRYLLCIP